MAEQTIQQKKREKEKAKRLSEQQHAKNVLDTGVFALNDEKKEEALAILVGTDYSGAARALMNKGWPFHHDWLRTQLRDWYMVANKRNAAKHNNRAARLSQVAQAQPLGMPRGTSQLLQSCVHFQELQSCEKKWWANFCESFPPSAEPPVVSVNSYKRKHCQEAQKLFRSAHQDMWAVTKPAYPPRTDLPPVTLRVLRAFRGHRALPEDQGQINVGILAQQSPASQSVHDVRIERAAKRSKVDTGDATNKTLLDYFGAKG